VVVWNPGTQLREERVSIHVGHHEVQKNQIRFVDGEEFQDLAGIGGLAEIRVPAGLQDALEQEHIGRLIVDDENPAPSDDLLLYQTNPLYRPGLSARP